MIIANAISPAFTALETKNIFPQNNANGGNPVNANKNNPIIAAVNGEIWANPDNESKSYGDE
ncbi:MAG: Uncharacterised protein [Arcobacter lacus]|nr:MAG: Uncharacterised protein [Arcobacter lacus]